MQENFYDVIVVGAGHAGCEAAAAAGRMSANVLLLTHNLDTIGQMSCNPAIGGIGKSHLVKEISAMGGVMPRAADRAAIHRRVLNASKGAAVQATRIQADRALYRQEVRIILEETKTLSIFQQPVKDLIIENDTVVGVITEMGLKFSAKCVVLTTGTFLAGKVHVGKISQSGGRAGDQVSVGLAEYLRGHGKFRFARLKTGTPPRLDRRSIDVQDLEQQPSSIDTPAVDFWHKPNYPPQMSCYVTYTNEKTHKIIREHTSESAIFSGNISGPGPRYCPSIEDKVYRFAQQERHQIFIEPEGIAIQEVYPNGISTSLPYAVQVDMIASIKGFENAKITRPGYAIEYDYFDPRDLQPQLESRYIAGLFFAGQINGTTGYEEAAAQGLLAGINAVLKAWNKSAWCPKRSESYIGVLVDDLVRLGTKEPYRMFTSRAEHRLLLREDNADKRLSDYANALSLLTPLQEKQWAQKKEKLKYYRKWLEKTVVSNETNAFWLQQVKLPVKAPTALSTLAKRPEVTVETLLPLLDDKDPHTAALTQVIIDAKYAGYIARQREEVAMREQNELTKIPGFFEYERVKGLSSEVIEKLQAARPHTVGSASRISGVTPAAIAILLVYLKRAGSVAPPSSS